MCVSVIVSMHACVRVCLLVGFWGGGGPFTCVCVEGGGGGGSVCMCVWVGGCVCMRGVFVWVGGCWCPYACACLCVGGGGGVRVCVLGEEGEGYACVLRGKRACLCWEGCGGCSCLRL